MAKPIPAPRYLAWIRTLPCTINCCGVRRIEAHHTGSHGLAQKSDDKTAIPLCWRHHKEFHDTGRRAFATKYNLDIQALVEQLNIDCPAYLLRQKPLEEEVAS